MRPASVGCSLIVALGLASSILNAQQKSLNAQKKGDASLWLTTPDKKALFERQNSAYHFAKGPTSNVVIDVDEKQKLQPIDGFGYALTGGSAQHMIRMDAAKRAALIKELFADRRQQHRRQLPAGQHRGLRPERPRLLV